MSEVIALPLKQKARTRASKPLTLTARADLRTAPLYTPPDFLEAVAKWNANCGPGALSAVLRRPVMATMAFLHAGSIRWPGYTSPSLIRASLDRLGIRWQNTPSVRTQADLHLLPRYGLATVQLSGPWEAVSVAAAYAHTHVIGTAVVKGERYVYDVNVGDSGGWATWSDWLYVANRIVNSHPGATGFWIRSGVDVGL